MSTAIKKEKPEQIREFEANLIKKNPITSGFVGSVLIVEILKGICDSQKGDMTYYVDIPMAGLGAIGTTTQTDNGIKLLGGYTAGYMIGNIDRFIPFIYELVQTHNF